MVDDDDNEGFVFPAWLVITIVVLSLWLFIGGCVCFTKRCFAPAGQTGPLDLVDPEGTYFVRHGDGSLSKARGDLKATSKGDTIVRQTDYAKYPIPAP